jgi:hypothetical protein
VSEDHSLPPILFSGEASMSAIERRWLHLKRRARTWVMLSMVRIIGPEAWSMALTGDHPRIEPQKHRSAVASRAAAVVIAERRMLRDHARLRHAHTAFL